MPEAELETKLLEKSILRDAKPQNATTTRPKTGSLSAVHRLMPPSLSGLSVSDRRVPNSSSFSGSLRVVLTFAATSAIAAACNGPELSTGPLFGTGVFHPPPKIGDSISHTQMCECKSCNPSGCCDGPEDDAPTICGGDSYDFSAHPECGTSVRSCASRCTREVWRVHVGQACDRKRPSNCCGAG